MIDALVEQVRAQPARVTGIELQWSLHEHDDLRCDWMLELHAIVEEPGPEHSQYSTVRIQTFSAMQLAQREDAHRLARAVADRVGVVLYAPPVEHEGGQGGSWFLRNAPAGAPAGYTLHWKAKWWTRDGRSHEAAGTELVDAPSGDEARVELERRLLRFPFRPITLQVGGHGFTHGHAPDDTPDQRALKIAAREETCHASRIARRFPAPAPLSLMLGFERAFGRTLDAFGAIAGWRAGEIDDAALDAALDDSLASSRRSWERSLILEERFRAGQGIAAFLRDERAHATNLLELIRDLREVFHLGLFDARLFLDRALWGEDDAEIDASLALRVEPP